MSQEEIAKYLETIDEETLIAAIDVVKAVRSSPVSLQEIFRSIREILDLAKLILRA